MPDAASTDPVPVEDAPPSRLPRWRWRVRLSLRALMIVVVLIGAPLGWMARRAAIQRRAVEQVRALGGRVLYEDQADPAGTFAMPHEPGGPVWLRRLVGDEPFQEVAGVIFLSQDLVSPVSVADPPVRHSLDDQSITVLNDFPRLQCVRIFGGVDVGDPSPARPITAEGLARLSGIPHLRDLHLERIGVDAAMVRLLPRWAELEAIKIVEGGSRTLDGSCLRALGDLPRLRSVFIDSLANPKAEDVAPLLRLDHLEHLGLVQSPRDDAGVAQLGALSTLVDLQLPQTALSDATLAALGRARGLFFLEFDGSKLGPGALRGLSGSPRLEILTIRQGDSGSDPGGWSLAHRVPTRFHDEDLDALQGLPLNGLMLPGLDATDAGVARLLAGRNFELLTLSGRGITDASVPVLLRQVKLDTLALANTSLTDAGLAQLAALPRLRNLALVDNSAVTDAGMGSLKSIPKLSDLVYRQPGTRPETIRAVGAGRRRFRATKAPADPP